MVDLISKQTIIDGLEFVIKHGIETDGAHSISAEAMLEFVRELPTVQPNIVRCKECKHRYVEGDNVRYNTCELNHNKVQSDEWFCADAEKREAAT